MGERGTLAAVPPVIFSSGKGPLDLVVRWRSTLHLDFRDKVDHNEWKWDFQCMSQEWNYLKLVLSERDFQG